jgi:Cu2+-exporting ATPase
LIRGGDILEAASHIDTVVFDKTGTLTAGKPEVTAVKSLLSNEGLNENQLLALTAAVERSTTHPVAQALVRAAARASGSSSSNGSSSKDATATDGSSSGNGNSNSEPLLPSVQPGTFNQEPGSGVRGIVDGKLVCVGTLDWLSRQGTAVSEPQQAQLSGTSANGGSSDGTAGVLGVGNSHTRVYVSIDGRMAGFMDVQDALRPDAKGTVEELHAAGIRTVMISGDNKAAAHEVAGLVGIQPGDVYANVKPAGELCAHGVLLLATF